jgi:alkylation response protein AidB-like acyl-CoA dehydrogenase
MQQVNDDSLPDPRNYDMSDHRPALTELTEDEQIFQEAIASFATKAVAPHVERMDHDQKLDQEIIDQCFQLGLTGIEVPEEYGGSGSSFFNAILAVEELAKVDPSVSVFVDVQNTLVNNAILRWATEEQKKKYFPKLCRDWVGAYALSEPASGSDAFALRTRAEDCGDHYKLNGNKLWITNGAEANLYVLFATVDADAGYRGITAFLVERDFDGFSIGKKEDKLGIRASSTVELILEDCVVPKENVLGEVGKGYKAAIETLNEGRIGIGAQMIGLAQGAFEAAMDHMLEREQFGQPIAHFQGLQFQYAQLAAEIEAAKLMVYNAARMKDAGQNFVKQAAMAKLYSSQVAERVASKCVEFHGGVGFTKEYPAEKFYRDAKIGAIYEGTTNMQLQTIAKLLLDERS